LVYFLEREITMHLKNIINTCRVFNNMLEVYFNDAYRVLNEL